MARLRYLILSLQKINGFFWMLRLSRLIATDSNPKTENKMKKGKDIFNVIKLEEKGASAKLLQLQLEANEILHSEQENYQSYLSAKRIGVALAEIKEKVNLLEENSPRKSEFLQKLDSILAKLREYYQFQQRYWSGAEALDSDTNEQITQAVKYFNYRMFQWAKMKTVDGAVVLLKRHKQIKDELINPFWPDFANPAFDKAPKELIHYLSLYFNVGCEE